MFILSTCLLYIFILSIRYLYYIFQNHKFINIICRELERALLTLPFSKVTDLLHCLDYFASHMWEPELTTRCVLYLLKYVRVQLGILF